MAQEININVNVDDKGSTKKLTLNAKDLTKQLNEANKEADNMGKKRSAALEGAMRRSQPAGPKSTPDPEEIKNYNSARLAGGTSARDFAAQAQGLGGLVRLYATFAANIYAVSTAFNALKEASNVDKMIEASNKFSTVTGNNMNSIAKSLQKATDYTLSFQDAIKFSNIGTSAGLTGKEIENLTVIAKGAAAALGRDVGESIQRIIQGTAKQEQEILDELGIFVKSKKAFEEYAKARDIKVDDLTARQRTLAYADAVAKAGAQWKEFATIEDPYAKLTASAKQALQEILSAVNKLLIPLVNLFANNADAIKSFATLISVLLVKKALPELKNALTDVFSFKSFKAKENAEIAKNTLVNQYTDLNARLAKLKEERDKLANLDISSAGNSRVLKGIFDPNSIQKRSGADIDYGLSLQKATSSVFGTDKNPIDISKYKDVEAVQARITAGLKDQLSNEKTRDTVLQSLIAKKIVEEGSNAKNLILTESTKKASQEVFQYIEKQNAATIRRNALEKEYLLTQKAVGNSKKSLESAGILGTQLPVLNKNNSDFVGPPTKGTAAMNKFSESVKGVVFSYKDFTHGLTANSDALLRNQAQAGQGYLAGLKNFLGYLGTYKEQIGVATTATAGFGRVAGVAGGTLSFLGGALSIVARGFMAALGPLTLLWTAWEIFGDSIKEFFGWSKAVEEQQKAVDGALKEYNDTLSKVNITQQRSNELLKTFGLDSAQYQKASEAKTAALKSEIEAYAKYIEEIEKLEQAKKAKEEKSTTDKKFGKDRGELIRNAESQLASLRTAQNFSSLTLEDATKYNKVEEGLTSMLNLVKNNDSQWQNFTYSLKQYIEQARKLKNELNTSELMFSEQQTANITKIKSGIDGAAKALDDLEPGKLKALNLNLDPKALAVYEGFSKLPKISTLLQPEKVAEYNVATQLTVDFIKDLAKKTESLKNKSIELAEVRQLNIELLEAEANVANADNLDGQRQKAVAVLDDLKKRVLLYAQGNSLGLAKITSAALDAGKNNAYELSKIAKAELAKIKLEIDNIENSLKGLQVSLKFQDKISGLTDAISGKISDPSTLQLRILEEEEKLAIRKAFLVKREVELRNKGNAELKAEAEALYASTVRQAEETKKVEITMFAITQLEKQAAEAARLSTEARALENQKIEAAFSIKKAELDLQVYRNLEYQKALGYTSEEISLYQVLAEKQGILLSQEQARMQIERERAAELEKSRSAATLASDAVNVKYAGSTSLADNRASASERAAIEAEYLATAQKINEKFNERVTAAETLNRIAKERLDSEIEMKNVLAGQAKEMSKVSKLAGTIEKAFAGTGLEKQAKALSSFIKSSTSGKQKLAQLDNAEKKRKQDISKLEEEAKNGSLKAQSELNMMRFTNAEAEQRYAEERKEAELDATMSALEGFKSLMSEKTAGYKLISGIERAMYTYKMVMQAKELAMDIAATAQFVANGFQKIAVNATEAVTNQGKGDPYTAFARIAAMIALMASITGKSSGASAGAPPAGTTAKDRQETQGTGTSWVNGKKVENGSGVLGDAEAKSESIKNSLEIIKENSIEGLSFDNKMLKALESIDRAISGVSVSLYRIPGIRTGSAFGTVEGSQGGKGAFLQNFVSQLFGNKKVDQKILDSGVKLAGTFADLAKGTEGLISFYETVQTTTTKSRLFGLSKSVSTSINTSTSGAPPEITQAVSSIFTYATNLFKDVGARIGKTAEEIDTQLSGISFDQLLSLRDLKGEDLEKEFNAVISSMLDSTANTLFAEMRRFQKFGEGMLETVVRVVDANKKLNEGLDAIGQSSALKSANKSLNYDITEKLLEAVGGLEAFNEQIESFRDTFLSEAERIAPVAAAVKEEMSRLGYSLVDTRAEFKSLVQGLDLTIPAQQELYASLMKVAKSFAEVYEETEKVLTQQEYRSKIADLEINGLRLLGHETAAVRHERELEIEELRKLVPAQADQLIYYQKVTWAIEDSMEIRNAEIEVLGTLGFTYDQLAYQREVELLGLNDQLKSIKKWQFAVEDYNASQDLMIELLGHVGDGTRAVTLTRERELKGLNATDKSIKRAIFAMEDEESIREKLKEIREEETSTLKDNISATKDYIRSLKEYKSSLLVGNLSTLTPTQKYDQLKSEVQMLAAKATAPANTEEERKTQKEARDKLQSSTSAWLEASRILFASSDSYTNDFKSVLALVDSVTAATSASLTDAERQLEVLKNSENLLGGIQENTKTSVQLMADLAVAQANTAAAIAQVPENLASVYKVDELTAHIATLPEVIASLPNTFITAINSVTATGSAAGINLPILPNRVGAFSRPPGYVDPQLAGDTAGEQSLIEMTGYSAENNVLTRQLIDEVIALKNEVIAMKQEARENTGAVVEAEVNSAVLTGDRVTTGVSNAVSLAVWNSNNNVMLR